MYWLRRPPYLRWIAAGLVLLGGLYFDLRPTSVVAYPFAGQAIPAGEPLGESVVWRDVPRDLLPPWATPVTGVAGSDIAAGDPLLPSSPADVSIPATWWAVPVPLPAPAAPGTLVRLILTGSEDVIDGIVAEGGLNNGFEVIGMVAFPPSDAERVAKAAGNDALVVMVGLGIGAPISSG